jgi:cyclopropane fatty-acyl-phospholipid synthase-like methyltransferase
LLRPAGRIAFLTIIVSPGLSKTAHRIAVRLGPRAIASTRPLDALMTAAGFRDVEVTDVTESFLRVARAWQSEFLRHERELREVMGDEWEERYSDRADMIRGVEEGLLRRVFVTGTTP